jgi:L-ascorbate metabolism protein UlaG (beta-lactamase superfamily)
MNLPTASLTFIGHATLLIEMNGMRVLTDPILRQRVTFLERKGGGVDYAHLPHIDAVLISHLHYDHLDLPSLRLLGKDVRLIVPNGSQKLFKQDGFKRIEEMHVNEITTVGPLTIRATYARHSTARHPLGDRAICLGFIISGQYNIYFPGDTDIFPEMIHLADNLDLALMPVWGWGPTLGSGHMDPLQAAKALALLEPRAAIPIHWGTLHPSGLGQLNPRHFLTEPPHVFARYAGKLTPEIKIHLMPPGDSVDLNQLLAETQGGKPNYLECL